MAGDLFCLGAAFEFRRPRGSLCRGIEHHNHHMTQVLFPMTQSTSKIVVVTYNIRLGIQQGLAAVSEVLHRTDPPDLVAVQEIGVDWLMGPRGDSVATLSELLELPHCIHAAPLQQVRDDGPLAQYGHALFSRWPITSSRIIDLPRHDDEPRALLHCLIEMPKASLDVYSTHLSHLAGDRPDQGRFLTHWLNEQRTDTDARLLLGDLNAPPTENWLISLLETWTDADSELDRPTFPSQSPERRIDYIMARGVKLRSVEVPDSPQIREASDHRPVITCWDLDETSP